MPQDLVERIRDFIAKRSIPTPFPPTSKQIIESAELAIGFGMPTLLRACYLALGNGGFGPGLGIIGIENGYVSDLGDLVGAYRILDNDLSQSVTEGQHIILPFCEWGCSTFSCVRCDDSLAVYTYEEGSVASQGYNLDRFFEMWIEGIDILAQDPAVYEVEVEFINPFTGRKEYGRRKRRHHPQQRPSG